MDTPTKLTDSLRHAGDRMWETAADAMPRLATAVVIVVLGLVVAAAARWLVHRIGNRLRLDRASAHLGVDRLLQRTGYTGGVVPLLGHVARWVVLLIFAHAALDALRLRAVSDALAAVIGFLPDLGAALLVVLVGGVVASVVSRSVTSAARENAIDYGPAIARLASTVILVVTALVAVAQLRIETSILRISAIILVAGSVFAASLTIALGCREITRNIMAGFYAKKLFRPGDEIELLGHRGVLVAITPIQTVVESNRGTIVLANSIYLRSVIRRDPVEPDDDD